MKKEIVISFDGEDYSKLIEKQNQEIFLIELQTLELKYSIKNIERYTEYLKTKLKFPIKAFIENDNGMFGKEILDVKIEGFVDEKPRQGLRCLCSRSGAILKIPIMKLNINSKDKLAKEEIEKYQEWYDINHVNKK